MLPFYMSVVGSDYREISRGERGAPNRILTASSRDARRARRMRWPQTCATLQQSTNFVLGLRQVLQPPSPPTKTIITNMDRKREYLQKTQLNCPFLSMDYVIHPRINKELKIINDVVHENRELILVLKVKFSFRQRSFTPQSERIILFFIEYNRPVYLQIINLWLNVW